MLAMVPRPYSNVTASRLMEMGKRLQDEYGDVQGDGDAVPEITLSYSAAEITGTGVVRYSHFRNVCNVNDYRNQPSIRVFRQ